MKTLFVSALFVLQVLGDPFVRLVRFRQSLKPQCVVANDLVCPRSDITFWLYTKSTQTDPTKLDINTLERAPWVDAPLKFIVHGYSVDRDTAINDVLRPAYFSAGDYNIISVDWSALGQEGCYFQAVENVPTVAKCVADFFNEVIKTRKFSDVHLLGHSMGAHVAAWASDDIPSLPRLTKFDIAHPLFTEENSKNGTAGFIDVYHSNSGLKGQRQPTGNVDVYFNNDVFQPGCKCDTSCSHLRAVEYYAESIQGTMKAFPCGGWTEYLEDQCKMPRAKDLVVVGEGADTKKRGAFTVFTTSEPPFLLEDDVYTNEASFDGFKDQLAGECRIAHNIKRLVRDWLL